MPWEWDERQLEVPVRARSVMKCLYAFANDRLGLGKGAGGEGRGDGDEAGWLEKGWVDLEDAAGRARQIWGWLEGWQG